MVSYKPLFKLLIDRDLSKVEFRRLTNISPNTMTKIVRGEEVSMSILNKICAVLHCDYSNIIEYIPDMNKRKVV